MRFGTHFGHFHSSALLLKKLVKGLLDAKIENEGIQRGCVFHNHIKATSPSNEHRLRGSLDLIHSYVCGCMYSSYLTWSLYYVTLIDDSSCKAWIILKTRMKF